MRHSLWYCGVLIGEAKMQKNPAAPRQLVGEFRPTAYGRELLPRLTGVLSAAAALKDDMAARGITEESVTDPATGPDLIESMPGGRKMVDIGRTLSEVRLRDPSGVELEFKTIAFLDLGELESLARKLGTKGPFAKGEGGPHQRARLLVSATLAPPAPTNSRVARAQLS